MQLFFYTSAKKGILFHFSHENIENPIKLFFNSPKSMLQKCLYKFLKSMQWICYGYKDIRGFQKIPKTETKQFNHLFLYFNFFQRYSVSKRESFFKIPHKYALICKIFLKSYFFLKQIKFPLHRCQISNVYLAKCQSYGQKQTDTETYDIFRRFW